MAPVRSGRRDGRANGRREGHAVNAAAGSEEGLAQPPGLAPPGLGPAKAMAPAKVDLASALGQSPSEPRYVSGPLGIPPPYMDSQAALVMQQHRAMQVAAAQLHYAAACAQHQQQLMLRNMQAAAAIHQAAASANAAATMGSPAAKPAPSLPMAPAQGQQVNSSAKEGAGDAASPRKSGGAAHGGSRGHDAQTLSSSLQALSREPPDCLFIVRRINKLGFKASRTLKRHFSSFGIVVRVLVAHSTVRQHGDPQSHARRRPSSLGFVQMASAAAVLQVLARGSTRDVEGASIIVQKFERQDIVNNAEDEDGEDGDFGCNGDLGSDASPVSFCGASGEYPRALRSFSEATTASTPGSYPASPVLKASVAAAVMQ